MNLDELLGKFHIKVHKLSYFIEAFTHSSYANEKRDGLIDYERIEFIGDGVLDLITADLIFKTYPNMKQGDMTKLRSLLVCSSSLAQYANKFEFQKYIRMGQGQIKDGGANQKILEDVFEAFIGATYLDQGFEFTYSLLKSVLLEDIINFDLDSLTDYKSRLQEDLQSNHRGNIKYEVVEEIGSAQDKIFVVEVYMVLEDKSVLKLGKGQGKNKKQAEESAAKDALSKRAGN